jgi:putative endonuclease
VVEHLLAKEDVASSSLVTRSSLRLECSAKRRLERVRRSLAKADRLNPLSYGWQASFPMHYVYLLKSQSCPKQPYVGSTRDLRQRFKEHNEGRSPHTAKFRPWTLIAYIAFAEEKTAIAFEKYLKSGSGRAFIRRHFL